MSNKVFVTTTQAIVAVTEETGLRTVIETPASPVIVTAYTEGPMGPRGELGNHFADLDDVDISTAVSNSVLYYDADNSQIKADPEWTINTLTDGGNW